MAAARWKIVEELADGTYQLLDVCHDQTTAEHMLTRFLSLDHDAYLVDGEEDDADYVLAR